MDIDRAMLKQKLAGSNGGTRPARDLSDS